MLTKDIRDKDEAYLHQELKEQLRHLFDLRTQAVTEKLEDPSQINKTRRHIARVKTILRERTLKIARASSDQPAVAAASSAVASEQSGTQTA